MTELRVVVAGQLARDLVLVVDGLPAVGSAVSAAVLRAKMSKL